MQARTQTQAQANTPNTIFSGAAAHLPPDVADLLQDFDAGVRRLRAAKAAGAARGLGSGVGVAAR
ncbi:hypothetical protein B484DRAFT_407828 [Ochromonadaceae sp. CCMP2298]|nr:hypothetical protein B484DRAFT_407828 [Ochromonadaceae sp. CCMP2298]